MRKLTGRTLIAGMLGLGLALTGCGGGNDNASSASGSLQTVNIGYNADFNGASVLAVAQQQNLFAKYGLKANLKVFTNGPLQVQALRAGDLDFGYLGPGALWLPATGQAKIIAINSVGLADRVIAQPGINSVADLKGKTVGVPEGTSGEMILRIALKKAGLTISDVKKVAMDPSTIVTAFTSHQIDAAGIWYPLIDTIKKRVPGLRELASTADLYPQTTFPTAFIARNDVASGQPNVVTKMDKVIREANDYRAAHLDDAVTATAELLKAPKDTLQSETKTLKLLTSAELDTATADGTVNKWLTGLNTLFTEFGKDTAHADPRSYYLGSAYTAAGK